MKKISTLILSMLCCVLVVMAQPPMPSACIVSVDPSTNFNMVAWDKAAFPGDSYNIYKQDVFGVFNVVGNWPSSAQSIYFDINGTPDSITSSYKISTVDNVTGESFLSTPHTTMFVSYTQGIGVINVSWTAYAGLTFASYRIWRGTSSTTLTVLDSVSSATLTYQDISPLLGPLCYRIEMKNPFGCFPDLATDKSSSFSNTICGTTLDIDELSFNKVFEVHVAPNPFNTSTIFTVSGIEDKIDFEMFNMIGKRVQYMKGVNTPTFEVARNQLPDGIYLYRIVVVETRPGLVSTTTTTIKTGKVIID